MKTIIRCCVVAALVLTAGAVGFFAGAQETPAPKAERTLKVNEVARVGERVFSAEEFIQRIIEREGQYQDPDMRTARAALDSLVLEELLTSECDRLEAWPKRTELDAEYAALNAQFDEQRKRDNKDIETPYTREEYIMAKTGLSVPEFDAKLREAGKAIVIRRLLVNYWMMTSKSADAEGIRMTSKEALLEIRGRLLNGENLAQIAREHSNEPHSGKNGGKIGTIYPGDGTFEARVEELFWDLKDGEWSGAIQSEAGYWLLRKPKSYLANEAKFHDLRDKCFGGVTPSDAQLTKWHHALVNSGRITYEQRMPGWDVQPGEE